MVKNREPIYVLVVNGADVTTKMYENSASMTYVDNAGEMSDELSITIAGSWDIVKFSDKARLLLGYLDDEVWECGTFEVQSVKIGAFETRIKATSTSFNNDLKTKQNRVWHKKRVSDIVSNIAHRHNLKVECNIDTKVVYLSQANESDIHLLTRIAKEHNALFKIKDDRLLFVKREELGKYSIDIAECSNYSITFKNRTVYGSAIAEYYDSKENSSVRVKIGSGKPVLRLEEYFDSKEEARRVAQNKLKEQSRGKVSGSLSIYGMNIVSGGKIELVGDDRIKDMEFTIKKATHTINSSGFSSVLEFES